MLNQEEGTESQLTAHEISISFSIVSLK